MVIYFLTGFHVTLFDTEWQSYIVGLNNTKDSEISITMNTNLEFFLVIGIESTIV
jgi:hypothetical protein